MIDGRFLSSTPDGAGPILLRGKRTLADVKTKSCDGKYAAESTGAASAVDISRQTPAGSQRRVYHKKAAEVDLESDTAPGDMGPIKRSPSE